MAVSIGQRTKIQEEEGTLSIIKHLSVFGYQQCLHPGPDTLVNLIWHKIIVL
jgi:hypothetical protein